MNEIIINTENDVKSVLLLTNGILTEKYEYEDIKKQIEGNIYIGILEDILIGMEAAFIDIGKEKKAFIHFDEILGKNYTKEDIKKLKKGMKLIVQVKKDASNYKGARVSTNIQLTGRFLVYMPKDNFITISQKIENQAERERLTNILKKILPEGTGAIIRTSAENKDENVIKKELERLIEIWNNIKENADKTKPCLIYENYNIVQRMILDLVDKDISKILVNTKEDYEEIKKIIEKFNVDIELELKNENLLNMYNLNKEIEEISKRKIWLKCGGFITIDKTEALTAIDVNSGKYIGKENLEKTVFKVNQEASIEIAKQLRLRDIGGIIIIDYIDMHSDESKEKIIKILENSLKQDRAKTQIIGFSKLNLLELTRKHLHC